jgi:hypothetical protein
MKKGLVKTSRGRVLDFDALKRAQSASVRIVIDKNSTTKQMTQNIDVKTAVPARTIKVNGVVPSPRPTIVEMAANAIMEESVKSMKNVKKNVHGVEESSKNKKDKDIHE